MKKLKLILALLFFVSVFGQKEMVFFGSYNWEKEKEGLYVYELNDESGKLTKVASAKNIVNPSYLTISADGKYIYTVSDSKMENAGSVSSFSFNDKNKTLTYLNSQKSGGENPVYVTVHENGKWLVNGNYTEAGISVYPILENGKIDSIRQLLKFTEGSLNPKRQEKAHVHSVVFSPDYQSLISADLGADKIRIYLFDSSATKPLKNEKSNALKTTEGSGPRHLTFSKNGKFLYSIEEMAGQISVYDFSDNSLNQKQRIPTHSEKITEGFESSDVHISPDGKFLYATNRGKENNIAIFKIKENGTLENIGYQSTHGKHPRTFAISETGKFLIVTNVASNNAVVFKRNFETGMLKKVGKVKIENVSCVKTKRY